MHHGRPDVAHLLHERVLEGQVVPAVDEQLVFEVLRRVEVFAGWLVAVAPTLETGSNKRERDFKGLDRVRQELYNSNAVGITKETFLEIYQEPRQGTPQLGPCVQRVSLIP